MKATISNLPNLTSNEQTEVGHSILMVLYKHHIDMNGVRVAFENEQK